ncbi:M48 family metallopeptidase [Xylophilus sp. GW821-FHT01B05]
MDEADFIHLVRLSEHASADNSAAYRRRVMAFAALGYAWVIACVALACALLWWVASLWLAGGRFRVAWLWLLAFAAGLLWSGLRALWLRLDPPDGLPITADDAPALFQALERIRSKIKGPPIHRVYVNADFNACVSQRPRYGLFGGSINELAIGLPLAMALDKPRLLAVLAHEYGHLRGDHGRVSAWIYRTRLSWGRLYQGMRRSQGVAMAATQAFLNWYFPRFAARTFALARQDEYEADRIAGRLLGAPVAAAALTEIEIKGAWLAQEFWPAHWHAAALHGRPLGPFGALQRLLALPPDEAFARQALQQALRSISQVDDTHPGLRDRLEALAQKPALPDWSTRPALALLGPRVAQWIEHFDREWCEQHTEHWRAHHAWLARLRARTDELLQGAASNNAEEMAELGDLCQRLDPHADAQPHYRRALEISADHPRALQGLAQCLPPVERPQCLALLERLYSSSPGHRWWASSRAVAALEVIDAYTLYDDAALKRWRERRKQAEAAEGSAWEELTTPPWFSAIAHHDLNEFELGLLKVGLQRCEPLARAWLVRRNLREFPYRRCYLLFIELPDLHDEDRFDICRSLERTLELPGPVLALWAGDSPTLDEIERKAFAPVFARRVR